MKVSRQQQPRKYSSGRTGAIVDIDTIIAYMIFITIIVSLVNYLIGLTAPFRTSVDSLAKEEGTITIKYLTGTEFNAANFTNSCSINYASMRLFSLSYEIKGFRMPFTDSINSSATNLNGSVTFTRDDDTLYIETGSMNELKLIDVNVIIPKGASVTNISLDDNDYFSTEYNEFENYVVKLVSNVENGDTDKIMIKPVNGLVTFTIGGINNLSDSYIGSIKLQEDCGNKGLIGRHTSFNKYGSISDERQTYPAVLTGDIWWIN